MVVFHHVFEEIAEAYGIDSKNKVDVSLFFMKGTALLSEEDQKAIMFEFESRDGERVSKNSSPITRKQLLQNYKNEKERENKV